MLTTLPTVKSRLAIDQADPQYDALLTARGARFDKETNRTLARTVDFQQELDGGSTEVLAACYPIETVTKLQTKTSEATGWQEIQPAPDYLIRHSCIISPTSDLSPLTSGFRTPHSAFRICYAAGYVMPGTDPQPGQTPLPPDLENAAAEQVAHWFRNRDHLGLKTYWPTGVAYQQFATQDLLDSVQSVLKNYRRWTL